MNAVKIVDMREFDEDAVYGDGYEAGYERGREDAGGQMMMLVGGFCFIAGAIVTALLVVVFF